MLSGKSTVNTTTASVIIDFGNSSTKVTLDYKGECVNFELSNRFSKMPVDYLPDKSMFSDTDSTLLRYINGDDQTRYLNGEAQRVEGRQPMRPMGIEHKQDTSLTMLSYKLTLLKVYREIARIDGVYVGAVTDEKVLVPSDVYAYMEGLRVPLCISTMLPAGDIVKGVSVLSGRIRDVDSVEFVYPNLTLTVSVLKVNIFPEGYCAYIDRVLCISGDKVVSRPDSTVYRDSKVLLIDIGGGTTNILAIIKGKPNSQTMQTLNVGGNTVMSGVNREIGQLGFYLNDNDLNDAMRNGYLLDGLKHFDIKDIIRKYVNSVANEIFEGIRGSLEYARLPISSMNYLMFTGGGAVAGNTAVPTLAEGVLDSLHSQCPDIGIVSYAEGTDLRLLNRSGAYLLSKAKSIPNN